MGSPYQSVDMCGHTPYLLLLLLLLCVSLVTPRRPVEVYDRDDHNLGNRLSPQSPQSPQSGRPSLDVGVFPYPRGETPVFNFDQGDEGFIATIPPLIHALDAIKDLVNKQRTITQAFGEAFDQCADCG